MSKISVVKEKDRHIFTKIKESDEELIFYNMDYFKRVGFPDAEIFIGEIEDAPTKKITGGYYRHIDKLTFPFRHFVYLIQKKTLGKPEGEKKTDDEVETPTEEPKKTNSIFPGGIYSFFQRAVDSGVKGTSGSVSSDHSVEQPETTGSNTYIKVTIPIVNEDYLINWGKYEKEEAKLNQIIREDTVEKSLGKSKIGEFHEIGTRYIRLCESLSEYKKYDDRLEPLEGSKMSKMSKIA